ncbi:ATP-binding protein [Catelliglobosispora koreensis]|uniref:ATP-binding protein n=1 Tax=Catelliglobosispora koreensis TaxID=129052 RepID=UPI00038274AB|nr:BTAD domain-containing putative transcriptional regulator [Catelliglobosispora koreensis]
MVLRVRLLGGLDIEGVEFAQLGSRKARTLLARLALGRGSSIAADALTEIIWPVDPPKRSADQLSVLVSRLRSVLGAQALPRVGRGYALLADWLDVDALAGLVTEARARLEAGGLAPARSAIDAALALDRGPLLPDEDPRPWLEPEREAAARASALARLTSAQIAFAAGDPWTAIAAAASTLDIDTYDEAALRLLMSACASAGRPAQGIAAYLEMAQRLRDELGIDPAAETTASYVDLLQQKVPAEVKRAGTQRLQGERLPGRERELRLLDEALADAKSGQAVSVAIRGEAGIGKSRLLSFWSGHLKDVAVLRATGTELGGDLALQPIIDAIAALLRQRPQREAELLQGAGRLLRPLIGAPAGGDVDRTLAALGEQHTGLNALYAAVDTVMWRLAQDGTVALLIDDAHWLDRATIGWIQHAHTRLADLPVLMVTASRPGEGATPAGSREIALGPLDLEAVQEIAGAARADNLFTRSAGHPLFLMELLNAGDEQLPESIRDAVAERCDRAGPAAVTLRAAAVLGTYVDLDLVSAVLNAPPTVLLDHLEVGVSRQLLTEDSQGFRFRHQLIRDALCAATGSSRTALLHRQAARSLHARGQRADPLDVAHHARLGGDLSLAAQALADAGELAAARYDHEEALRLFDEALQTADAPALRLRRARVALPAGRFQEAADDAGVALAGGVGAEGMEVAAIAAYLLRDFRRCRRLSEDGARLADDPRLKTSCLALAGRVSHVDGDLDAADEFLRAAQETAPAELRALAFLWSMPMRTDRGDPAGALELLDDASGAPISRHPFVVPHRHLATAQAMGMLGRAEEALTELAAVDEMAARQHTQRFTARAENCRAWILRNLGKAAEADACNESAYARSLGAAGMTEPVADALLGLADGRVRAGDAVAARSLLERAQSEAAAPHPFAWRHALRHRLLTGRCVQLEGNLEEAEEIAAEVIAEAERLGVPRYVAFGHDLMALARGGERPTEELRRYAPLELASSG